MVGSLMVWRTMSMSASPIITHCFTIHFLKFQMVIPNASFLSSWINLREVVEDVVYSIYILLGFFWILCSSIRPLSLFLFKQVNHRGCTSSKAIANKDVLDTRPKEGANWVVTLPKQGTECWFWQEQWLI